MAEPEIEAAVYWLWWINAAKTAGVFLVAVGVAAEFIGEFASRPFERTIETARKDQASKLTNETARLEAEAQLARAATANATARA